MRLPHGLLTCPHLCGKFYTSQHYSTRNGGTTVPNVTQEGSIDPIFVSVKQAAQALNISTWVCYQLLDKGAIRSKYHGRRRLVFVDSLRDYAEGLPDTPEDKSA